MGQLNPGFSARPCSSYCPSSSASLGPFHTPLASELTNRGFQIHSIMSGNIEAETLKQYLADSPPTVVPLAIKPHFEALTDKEKLYAHHISL